MFYSLKLFLKKIIPRELILATHKLRGMAAAFYFGFPAKKLRVIGVAGTKGKTTTTNLITRILERAGHRVAMFSTANMRVVGEESLNTEKLTTPSPFFLQKFLREAVKKNCDYAVIEVSSHALIQSRLFGIDFHKAVITNLMPDHLDYHKDADEYRDVHLEMIGSKTEEVIINGDDEQSQNLIRQWADSPKRRDIKILSFGLKDNDELMGRNIQLSSGGVKFNVLHQGRELGEFVLNIPGKFSVYNALAAIALGVSEAVESDIIRKALAGISGVPGRLEKIKTSDAQDFEVIVDYAHSPDSLKNVYEAIKPYVKNRLIAVLGGTGDRDKTYRARAGALADQFADIVIVTNEDPYSEDAESIMEQVLSGIKNKKNGENLFRILDRREAIRKAVDLAAKNDVILITGKGSEQFMVWGDKKIPWDDREVAREVLKGRFNPPVGGLAGEARSK
ncbi:MAG: UDP-N-acetylmuramoyl-L-alanyl-D-glutamate--2,6-diaminopimelate ligase [bacterium]|nr:UDP-N-acetylmuramoyl-L-alanyl-D-glutamate--2,6-diaminopimelate ligase [bacterium]